MSALQRAWLRRGALACGLWPLSLLYATLAGARRWTYRLGWRRVERLPVPVVVVGNVVAGGAGKTPVVIALARHFAARGVSVGVISRGHGRRREDDLEVLPGSDPRDVGDEPALIRQATGVPVAVARRRADAGRLLLARHPGLRLILADDGLQHLALARDIEVCVFDDRGVGNGWLLPAGPLREPWPRRCDLVLHSGGHPAFAGFTGRRALADHALGADGRTLPLAALAGRPLVALAGIAQPQRFFDMLRERGLSPTQCIALPDHHDFDAWQAPAVPPGGLLLCTEKDAVKLWRRMPEALAVPLEFTPEPAFLAALEAKLSFLDGHQAA